MSARESGNDGITFRVKGAGAVTLASDAARTFATEQGLSDDDLARLCIIVEELVANLYEHGDLAEHDEVTIRLVRGPSGTCLTIEDKGTPFDPRQAPAGLARPTRGGGAGIDLVRAWATITDYRSVGGVNWLDLFVPSA